MNPDAPILRHGARVLLVDSLDRVLLFRGRDPGRPDVDPYWFTVGGGLDPGETSEQAAIRETYEETGLRLATGDLVGPVWEDVAEFPFDGRRYRQPQVFFLVRVETWQVDTSAFAEVEVRTIDQHRWWSADDLDCTSDIYFPPELPALLRRVLSAAPKER
ncbi:MAG: NUDIX domain-containing protein [Mycobacteriales bacterium]